MTTCAIVSLWYYSTFLGILANCKFISCFCRFFVFLPLRTKALPPAWLQIYSSVDEVKDPFFFTMGTIKAFHFVRNCLLRLSWSLAESLQIVPIGIGGYIFSIRFLLTFSWKGLKGGCLRIYDHDLSAFKLMQPLFCR